MMIEIPQNHATYNRKNEWRGVPLGFSDNFKESYLVIGKKRIPCLRGLRHMLIDLAVFPKFKTKLTFLLLMRGEEVLDVAGGSTLIPYWFLEKHMRWKNRFEKGIVIWPPYIILYFYKSHDRNSYAKILKLIIEDEENGKKPT